MMEKTAKIARTDLADESWPYNIIGPSLIPLILEMIHLCVHLLAIVCTKLTSNVGECSKKKDSPTSFIFMNRASSFVRASKA